MTLKLKSFHFNVGNSAKGSLGMCLRVKAYSKKEAVEKANGFLESTMNHEIDTDGQDIEYCEIYFSGNLKPRHIDDYEDVEGEDCEEMEP